MTQIRLGPTRNQIALKRAILEMTSTCNLFCQHCSRDSYPMKYKGEMTDEEWFSVVTAQLLGGKYLLKFQLNLLSQQI